MEYPAQIIIGEDIMSLCSIMSDLQEEITDKRLRGKLNLLKGFLFGNLEIERDGLTYWFKAKNPKSRFCDKCGLLRVSKHKECEC